MEFIIREDVFQHQGGAGIYAGNMERPGVEQQKYEADNRLKRSSASLYLSQCSEKICFLTYMVDCR